MGLDANISTVASKRVMLMEGEALQAFRGGLLARQSHTGSSSRVCRFHGRLKAQSRRSRLPAAAVSASF